MLRAQIRSTQKAVFGEPVDSAFVASHTQPPRDPIEVLRKTGIRSRYWSSDASFADQGVMALRGALQKANLPPTSLKKIIFASSSGGDQLIPATVNAVLRGLNLFNQCDGFDLNNACMGFLSAFDLAARLVVTGVYPVAVVVSEQGSKLIDSSDPRPYLIFGDGAVAIILDKSEGESGVIASVLGNDPLYDKTVTMNHPLLTRKRELIQFNDSNAEIGLIAMNTLKHAIARVLEEAQMDLSQVSWLAIHQPNGILLEKTLSFIEISPDKTVSIVDRYGSLGAASAPFCLDSLFEEKPVKKGDVILIAGVGAGLSYGAILYRHGERE